MTLVTSIPWLARAKAAGFALGGFNANTLEQMQAIVAAAQEERAPVIVQISRNAVDYMGAGSRIAGLRYAAEMGRVAAQLTDAPVILHLDHGSETDILQALALGFTSVMFDGSDLPYEENVARTKMLCEAAHDAGAAFEAELGEVPRANIPGMEEGALTDPGQVTDFVERTGIDALAVAIGSVHALQRKTVALDFALLDRIAGAVDLPLVLHGSSGVLDADICEGICRGLCKINVATQLNAAFTAGMSAYLSGNPTIVDPRKYLGPAREMMKEQVRERMRMFGVSGRA